MIGSLSGAAAAAAAALETSGTVRGAGRMLAWRVHAYVEPQEAAGAPRLEEARVPPLRAPDDLLVRVRAASVNPIDIAMIGGYGNVALNAQRRLLGAAAGHVEFPLTVGRDFCGVVEARGAAVDARLQRGARVWGALPPHAVAGSHAQFVRVKQDWVAPAPEALSDAECAGAPYAALTAMALVRAAALPPPPSAPRVLLLGLGGVGQAALQLLAARGVHVTVSASPDQEGPARALGAREFLDKGAGASRGEYAAVLDCAGLGGDAVEMERWSFARYATVTSPVLRETDARGLVGGAAVAAARLAAQCARAAALPTPAPAPAACVPRVRWAFFSARAADLEALRRLAERGQFGVSVERVYSWREAREAYARAAAGSARGKLVLDFNDSDLC